MVDVPSSDRPPLPWRFFPSSLGEHDIADPIVVVEDGVAVMRPAAAIETASSAEEWRRQPVSARMVVGFGFGLTAFCAVMLRTGIPRGSASASVVSDRPPSSPLAWVAAAAVGIAVALAFAINWKQTAAARKRRADAIDVLRRNLATGEVELPRAGVKIPATALPRLQVLCGRGEQQIIGSRMAQLFLVYRIESGWVRRLVAGCGAGLFESGEGVDVLLHLGLPLDRQIVPTEFRCPTIATAFLRSPLKREEPADDHPPLRWFDWCPKCRYPLVGLAEVRCPECGWQGMTDGSKGA